MKRDNGISEELISMGSFLADYSRKMPYSVPDSFFAGLADNLQETIKELSEPEIVPAWGKKMPYAVPGGYFEALVGDIVSSVTSVDLSATFPKGSPLGVPVGYFESLPEKMLLAAKAGDTRVKKIPKIIPLGRQTVRNPIRWAAAAVMLMCIGLGSYETFYNRQLPKHEKMLASVSNNDIQDYLQHTYRLDVGRIVGNNEINDLQVDPKDIVQYLNETGWDQVE